MHSNSYQRGRLIQTQLAAIMFSFMLITAFNAQADHKLSQYYSGQAIEGYDPVAYFTVGEAAPGVEAHCYMWLGSEWHFSTQRHRQLFLANPGKYMPQFGGYSSVGSLFGEHQRADPRSWKIVDGKLYLFYKKPDSEAWTTD